MRERCSGHWVNALCRKRYKLRENACAPNGDTRLLAPSSQGAAAVRACGSGLKPVTSSSPHKAALTRSGALVMVQAIPVQEGRLLRPGGAASVCELPAQQHSQSMEALALPAA